MPGTVPVLLPTRVALPAFQTVSDLNKWCRKQLLLTLFQLVFIVFHWIGDEWVDLGGTVDTTNHTITAFTTDQLPFAIAAVPEPETYAMLLAGLGLVGMAARRRKPSGA